MLTPDTAKAEKLLYVGNVNAGSVTQVTSAGVVSPYISGLGGLPGGLDFDAAGNLYVMNFGSPATIQKVTPGGVVSTFATGFNDYSPRGLTFNPADGQLYVFDYGQGKVNTVSSSGVVSPFSTVPGATNGIFVGSDLYVTDNDNGKIYKVTSAGVATEFATGIAGNPLGIAYDGNSFYVGATNSQTLYKVTSGGVVSPFVTGIGRINDVLYDADTGNLLASVGNSILQVTLGGTVTTYASGIPDAYEMRFHDAVPEPGSWSLLVVGVGMALALRRTQSCRG